MIRTTRAQREALFRVFQRDFPNWVSPGKRRSHVTNEIVPVDTIQWRKFRAKAHPCFDGSGCIMLPWAGMWLGIETDGYTHS
jgi:hypothetical protein